jgi:hypothetical protein
MLHRVRSGGASTRRETPTPLGTRVGAARTICLPELIAAPVGYINKRGAPYSPSCVRSMLSGS